MPIVQARNPPPYPLITGVTGLQGEDTPETSGRWTLICDEPSYGEANNAPSPYHTVWGAFAGSGLGFSTAEAKPQRSWFIGALLDVGAASMRRFEWAPRPGSNPGLVTRVAIEIGSRSGDRVTWGRICEIETPDGGGNVNITAQRGCGFRLVALSCDDGGAHPGFSGIQVYGNF